MRVHCDQCTNEYDIDEQTVPPEGLPVKCGGCAHVFQVYRPDSDLSPGAWQLKQSTGQVVPFRELATLQRWIVERKATPADFIRKNEGPWRLLGEIADLSPFFQAVAPSKAPPPAASPTQGPNELGSLSRVRQTQGWETGPLPRKTTGNWSMGSGSLAAGATAGTPIPSDLPASGFGFEGQDSGTFGQANFGAIEERFFEESASQEADLDDEFDDDLMFRRPRWGLRFLIFLLFVAGGVAAAYALKPQFFRSVSAALWNTAPPPQALELVKEADRELRRDSYRALEGARAKYARALSLHQGFAEARAGLAEAEIALAEYRTEEAAELEATVPSSPDSVHEGLRKQITDLRDQAASGTQRAFAAARQALANSPDALRPHRAMADYYRWQGDGEAMRPLVQFIEKKFPHDPGLAYVLGARAAKESNGAQRAVRYFEAALEREPGYHRVRYKLARILYQEQNRDRAVESLQAILAEVPDHDRAQVWLDAWTRDRPPPKDESVSANPPKSEESSPRAAELSLDELVAQAERLREADKSRKALRLYEQALEREPHDPDILTGMAWCYFDLDMLDPALAMFRRVLDRVPRYTDAHMGLAETYRARGMKRDAVKHYRSYLKILPDGPDAPIARRMLEELGNLD